MGKRETNEEFFDITADPECIHNLANNPEMADLKQEMKTRMEAMLKELRWREIRKVLPQAKEGQTERTFHVERGGRAQDNRVSYDEMLSRTYVIYFAWDDMSEVAQARDRLQGSPFVESVEYCPVAEWE